MTCAPTLGFVMIRLSFFYLLGLIVRKIFPDPLEKFFAEMEKSGRLEIKQTLTSSEAAQPQSDQ